MMRGELLALIEPMPRMRMLELLSAGSPDGDMIWTPGAVPASADVTLVATRASIASALTMEAEPVNALLVDVP